MTPPPWSLTGHGLIALYPPGPHTPPGALMLVRYAGSPVGPYDELLWLTPAASPAGTRPQVQAIWVSTRESAVGGQRNWGLPKRLARFGWSGSARRGAVHVTGENGAEVARLAFEVGRPRLPVTTALIPAPLRTLAQPPLAPGGRWLLTRVGAAGQVTPARLTVEHADGLHPFLRHARPALTLAAPAFRLVFPLPDET
ncbi:hypothetical protein [Deinococcus budaensis]|uniref:Acetoacetate decarboxylase n=1 Tax=Deinococcus budaensis TaxID=1665626 RepID=A0A7W8GDJ1_9DEIO|nr:hypothetical protein [Deinococcus budaensis]MBB5233561.1 hypothetical protein [Deinococcus budaensis]